MDKVKDSDIVSGWAYNNLIKHYKEYDKKQKQLIYDLSNEVYDLKEQLKRFEEEEASIPKFDDPIMAAFLDVIEKHCDRSLFNKVKKWIKLADKASCYRKHLIRCEKKICELREQLNDS